MSTLVDDETPLLAARLVKKTQLPWFQFSIVLCLRLVEPLHSHVIYPFLPQLIRDIGITHGEESQVGYYAGILPSVFFLSQAFSSLLLSTASDKVGRKPVVLFCFVGLTISMLCFGLSKRFSGLILSWILNGASNASIAIVKSLLVDITDPTNIAQACAYIPISWHIGTTLAPLIGGSLTQPATRFPGLFGSSEFLRKYPYFLPCATAAAISGMIGLIAFKFLRETVQDPVPLSHFFTSQETAKENPRPNDDAYSEEELSNDAEKPLSLFALIRIPRVLIVAGNYASMSLIATGYTALHPLFLSTPIHSGGLGLPPSTIGAILSANEIMGGFLQVLFFPKIHDYWGSKPVFVAGVASMFPGFLCFPILSYLAKTQGLSVAVWAVIAFQSIITIGLTFAYSTILIFIAAASPNKASIGVTNGLCQVSVSILKAIGPALASSLFSLSMQKGYFGGYLVYFILLALSGLSIMTASLLPRKTRGSVE